MKINKFIKALLKNGEFNPNKLTFYSLVQNLEYDKKEFENIFPYSLPKADTLVLTNSISPVYKDLSPELNAIEFSSMMRSQEAENLCQLLKQQGYLKPSVTKNSVEVYRLTKTAVILSLTFKPFFDPLNTDVKEFDCFFCLITNDISLLKSINPYKFTMTPPWFIFSDVIFAHRHGPWRYHWEKFWASLSEEEKEKYIMLNSPPSEWLEWLTNGYKLF